MTKADLQSPTDLNSGANRDIPAELRALLADVFALYVKTKNFHWHMSGPHFRDCWRWIVAAGVLTFCVGVMIVAPWPTIGLWLLGAMLTVDLVFQGWGLIAFGLALKARASRRSRTPATV